MSLMVQIMVCRLFGAKPLFASMQSFCYIGTMESNLSQNSIKIRYLSFQKSVTEMSSAICMTSILFRSQYINRCCCYNSQTPPPCRSIQYIPTIMPTVHLLAVCCGFLLVNLPLFIRVIFTVIDANTPLPREATLNNVPHMYLQRTDNITKKTKYSKPKHKFYGFSVYRSSRFRNM